MHAGAFAPGSEDVLAASLDDAGADAQTRGAELRILHAVAAAPDVPDASAGLVVALVTAQRREERADPAVVEFVAAPLRPPLGGVGAGAVDRLRDVPQVLLGVEQVGKLTKSHRHPCAKGSPMKHIALLLSALAALTCVAQPYEVSESEDGPVSEQSTLARETIVLNRPTCPVQIDAVAHGADLPAREDRKIDYYFAASHLLDVMPNPWRGSEAARKVFGALLGKYPEKQVAANYVFVLESIRQHLGQERDRLSQRVFGKLLNAGTMRFIVVTNDLEFNRLPEKIETVRGKQANREDGSQYQLDLFDLINEDELNGLENKVATYLDQQERLFFWHRNRARKDYYVQGWKRGKIYADFIVTLRSDEPDNGDEFHQVFVVETKGIHLKGNPDTEYKRSVFDICSEHASRREWAEFVPTMRGKVMRFEVVDEDEWEQRLNAMLAA